MIAFDHRNFAGTAYLVVRLGVGSDVPRLR